MLHSLVTTLGAQGRARADGPTEGKDRLRWGLLLGPTV